MKRRTLIQRTAGIALGGFPVKKLAGQAVEASGAELPSATRVAYRGQVSDWHPKLSSWIAAMEKRGGGTLELSDGLYEISRPIRLPICVSLSMTPNAVLKAKAGFSGNAVLIKGGGNKSKFTETSGWIRGGVIDGAKLPITGIRVEDVQRLEIADLVVANALYKGIHLLPGGYEKNITRVRCDVDLDTHYAPGSIGIHYENGDSKVILSHVIGYETGVRSDGGANWFSTVHVWNHEPAQGPMIYCFYCNGELNTFSQCYADSPTIAGFYINKPSQSLLQCRVYYSRWAKDNSGIGFMITPEGKGGNYFGNALFADSQHRLAKAFDGDLAGACILGTTTPWGEVEGGLQNRIPSGESGCPPLKLSGTGFCLTQQTKPPESNAGELGEIRWVDDGVNAALWLKTPTGWKKSQLE